MGLTMQTNDDLKARYFELMNRFNQLGQLVPSVKEIQREIDAGKPGVKTVTAKMVLTEMQTIKAQMDSIGRRAVRMELKAKQLKGATA